MSSGSIATAACAATRTCPPGNDAARIAARTRPKIKTNLDLLIIETSVTTTGMVGRVGRVRRVGRAGRAGSRRSAVSRGPGESRKDSLDQLHSFGALDQPTDPTS